MIDQSKETLKPPKVIGNPFRNPEMYPTIDEPLTLDEAKDRIKYLQSKIDLSDAAVEAGELAMTDQEKTELINKYAAYEHRRNESQCADCSALVELLMKQIAEVRSEQIYKNSKDNYGFAECYLRFIEAEKELNQLKATLPPQSDGS